MAALTTCPLSQDSAVGARGFCVCLLFCLYSFVASYVLCSIFVTAGFGLFKLHFRICKYTFSSDV